MTAIGIRPALPADGEALRTIEWQAGAQFRDVGLAFVADHEPSSVEALAAYAEAGRGWVAVADDGALVGYVIVDILDGNAHIEQVSVVPDQQGRGIGNALVEQVATWARANRHSAMTLTTFTDVPWNRPLYEHVGFRVLAEDEIGAELRAVVAHEADEGLDPATRVCMQRDI